MADLPEHPATDGGPVEQTTNKEIERKLLDKLIWDEILWKWQSEYPSDRHVAPLFFRSDVVLHKLASLIGEQIVAARGSEAR